MVKAELHSDNRLGIVSSVMESTKRRAVWPVSLRSLTQLGSKSFDAFGDKWWAVDDVAEELHQAGLLQFSPIPNRSKTRVFSYAHGVTREKLEAFLHVFSEVESNLPSEFDGEWTVEKSRIIKPYLASLPLTEIAVKAKVAMGGNPAASHLLVEVPHGAVMSAREGNHVDASLEIYGVSQDPQEAIEQNGFSFSLKTNSLPAAVAESDQVIRDLQLEEPDFDEVVTNLAGEFLAAPELHESEHLFPDIIDPDLAVLFSEHQDTFTPDADGLISAASLQDKLGHMFPDATLKALESFFTHLIHVRKQFPVEKKGNRNFLTSDQALAIGSVLRSYLQLYPEGTRHRSFHDSTRDAQAAWREGSVVHELLISPDKSRKEPKQAVAQPVPELPPVPLLDMARYDVVTDSDMRVYMERFATLLNQKLSERSVQLPMSGHALSALVSEFTGIERPRKLIDSLITNVFNKQKAASLPDKVSKWYTQNEIEAIVALTHDAQAVLDAPKVHAYWLRHGERVKTDLGELESASFIREPVSVPSKLVEHRRKARGRRPKAPGPTVDLGLNRSKDGDLSNSTLPAPFHAEVPFVAEVSKPDGELVIFSEKEHAEQAGMWESLGEIKNEALQAMAVDTEMIIQSDKWPMPLMQFFEKKSAEIAEAFSIRPGDVPLLISWLQANGFVVFEPNAESGKSEISSVQLRAATLGMAAIRQKIGPVRILNTFILSPAEVYGITQKIGEGYMGRETLHEPNVPSKKLKIIPPERSSKPPPENKPRKSVDFDAPKDDGDDITPPGENYRHSKLRDGLVVYNKEHRVPVEVWAENPTIPTLSDEQEQRVREVIRGQEAQVRGVPRLDEDLTRIFYAPYGRIHIDTFLRDTILTSGQRKYMELPEKLHPLTAQAIRFLSWVDNGHVSNEFELYPKEIDAKSFKKDLEYVSYMMIEKMLNGDVVTLYDLMMEEVNAYNGREEMVE